LVVSERFRQLPLITRLYGPTHIVVDLGGSGALWDQLRLVATVPERRRMRVIGVTAGRRDSASPRADLEAQRESSVDEIVAAGPSVIEQLRQRIAGMETNGVLVENVYEDDSARSAALG
jgi:hypothetical protein